MLFIQCSGTPYEIGHLHGHTAKPQIHRTIAFYTTLFQQNCNLTWPQVLTRASVFATHAELKWPRYFDEMRGIADGAGVGVLEVVAINVRTEINFGMWGGDGDVGGDGKGKGGWSDGCTAVGWRTEAGRVWMGQNWDWMTLQKQNLIIQQITQPDKPTLIQVTEAGIIGKIGFNAHGVGTLFNAIRVRGADPTRLPAHFGLRMALESTSVADAVQNLERHGMAASAHILLGDATTVLGLEFTKSTFARCEPDSSGKVVHTNHLLQTHPGEEDSVWLRDSLTRLDTMSANVESLGVEPGWEEVSRLFEDEQNAPGAICRTETKETGSATLFNIVMDLGARRAVVRLGRPTEVEERIELQL